MATEFDEEIAEIESILNSGIKETIEDGQKIAFDIPSLERRLAELKRRAGLKKSRPKWGSINLGG